MTHAEAGRLGGLARGRTSKGSRVAGLKKTSSAPFLKAASQSKKNDKAARSAMFGGNSKKNVKPKKQKVYTSKDGSTYLA